MSTACVFVRRMGLYLIGNPIAALQVFGRKYCLRLTAVQCPSKAQRKGTQCMDNRLKGMQAIRPSRNPDNSPGLKQVSRALSTGPHPLSPVKLSAELKHGLCCGMETQAQPPGERSLRE